MLNSFIPFLLAVALTSVRSNTEINLSGKPTSQISTYDVGLAERAVDGNTNGEWSSNSCTHTSNDNNPWWKVDLGSSRFIGRVALFNRQDCCVERLEGAVVRIGNDANVLNNPACWSVVSAGQIAASQAIQLTCNLAGRYLSVNLAGQEYLTLCEVKAFYGVCEPEINLSGKPTSQISTYPDGLAARAVDGNTDGDWSGNSCTHTSNDNNPWWKVDLGSSTCIGQVVLFNRQDCCVERLENAVVRVGNDANVLNNPACSSALSAAQLAAGQAIQLTCNLAGRYLSVNLVGHEYLTLCEVKALYGVCI